MAIMVSGRPAVTVGRDRGDRGKRVFRTDAGSPPARLTPRGRIVVTGVSALLIGALSVALATEAQATHTGRSAQATHAGSSSAGRYVTKVLVEPGQSLWSLAESYDPDADPRAIVQQIRQLNSMAGDEVQAGAVLWVPRG